MINDTDRQLLEIVIDISQIIWKNDCEAVPALVELVNSLELTPAQLGMVTDAVSVESALDIHVVGEGDAYVDLVDGLNCIENKAYLKKVRRISRAIETRDRETIGKIIAETVSADGLLDPNENDAIYVTFLIRACLLTRDYASMEIIRNRLGETDGVR